ncbi:hypothetical protein TNCV_2512731, partial [Trichonephila clavipes]
MLSLWVPSVCEIFGRLDDWFLGVWTVTQSSIPCLDRFDVVLGEGGVFHFALWHGGDWLVDGIWKRGNVSPFARVRPQKWGKKDAFHRIPFLVNRANVKTAIITLGTGDLPSLLLERCCVWGISIGYIDFVCGHVEH